VTLPGAEDYKYFGAAKNLPSVREQLETVQKQHKASVIASKTGKAVLMERVSSYYLGFGGPTDGQPTTSYALSI
jgi:hypothetical protein